MDSLQQQVLSLLSEDWKSRIEIVRETGASEHEVQVALNELQAQIETSYGPVAGLKKARMYRLKSCSQSSSPPSSMLEFPLDESPTCLTRLPQLICLGLQILTLPFRLLVTAHWLLLYSLSLPSRKE
ncbi:MAG: hypothetical protein JO114_04160 [Planctomycetaceae bacterium]|nr:hypothetical protein [Planctomycetaceae bacterium]